MSFEDKLAQEARLRILQALNKQTDGRLSHRMTSYELEPWGFRKAPEWIRTQMRELVELGAAKIIEDSVAVTIVELTVLGKRHVDRLRVIEGILRPEPGSDMTGTADRENGAERERRSGRGRLSSLDLLPEEAHEDLQWARGELGKRDKTQADILHEFNGRLIDRGLEAVSKSAFNRFSVKHALLTRRLNEAQALFAGLAPRITPEKVDEQTVVLGEFIKLLIFEIVEAEGGAIGSKGAMELARAHLAVIQAQKVSAERRARLEAEFKADAAKAIDKVVTAKGLSPDVKEALRRDLFGIAAPKPAGATG